MSADSGDERPDHHDDLDATLGFVRGFLEAGVHNRRLASHAPALCTLAADGSPTVRTVILRGVDWPAHTLEIHTDVRSGKWSEIKAHPKVALHVYDRRKHLQLRLFGEATLDSTGAVAEAAFTAARPSSLEVYRVAGTPGTPIAAPDAAPARAGATDAREVFGVVTVRFAAIEYLFIGRPGHRRALFTFRGDAADRTWLVP